EEVDVVTADGLLVSARGLSRVRVGKDWPVLRALRREGPIAGSVEAVFELVARIRALRARARVQVPPEFAFTEEAPEPVPRLRIGQPRQGTMLPVRIAFDY